MNSGTVVPSIVEWNCTSSSSKSADDLASMSVWACTDKLEGMFTGRSKLQCWLDPSVSGGSNKVHIEALKACFIAVIVFGVEWVQCKWLVGPDTGAFPFKMPSLERRCLNLLTACPGTPLRISWLYLCCNLSTQACCRNWQESQGFLEVDPRQFDSQEPCSCLSMLGPDTPNRKTAFR